MTLLIKKRYDFYMTDYAHLNTGKVLEAATGDVL